MADIKENSIAFTNSIFWEKTKQFMTTDDKDFAMRLKNKETSFEVITNNSVPKLYFDIDYTFNTTEEQYDKDTIEIIETKGYQYLFDALQSKTGIEPNIAIATSHSATYKPNMAKYSVRYFVSNIKDKKENILSFVNDLNSIIKTKFDGVDNIYSYIVEQEKGGLFDNAIYDSNRKMRCINTSKPNEKRPLILKTGTIENTIITSCYDANCITLNYTPKQLPSVARSSSPACITTVGVSDIYVKLLYDIIGNKNHTRSEWISICGWCKSHATKEIFLNFIDGSWYDEALVMWDSMDNKNVPKYWLEKFAKDKDEKNNTNKYKYWSVENKKYLKLSILDKGSNDVAKYIAPMLIINLTFCRNEWFMYDEQLCLWRVTKEPSAKITSFIQRKIDEAKESLLSVKNRPTTTDEERKKIVKKEEQYFAHYKNVCSSSYNSQMIKYLKDYLYDYNFIDCLDDNIYKIAYQNGILDLKTMLFREGLFQSDFLTKTMPFKYEKATAEDMTFVKTKLKQICNWNEAHLNYYLSSLGYAMTGDSTKEQMFWYLRGQTAENGKSMIFEVLEKIMPNYVIKGTSNMLDKNVELKKEVATWRGKKIVWVNEISTSAKDEDTVKALCDGTSYKYNRNYATEAEIMQITFKLFGVSNNSLTIKGDAGVKRRFKMGQYNASFKEEFVTDDYEKLEFVKDKDLGDKLCNQYKNALLQTIFEYSNHYWLEKKLRPYPSEWQEEANETMANNNKFQSWFEEKFKIGGMMYKKEMDECISTSEFKNIKIKDELARMKVPYKYDSQKQETIDGKRCKGFYIGFEKVDTDEE